VVFKWILIKSYRNYTDHGIDSQEKKDLLVCVCSIFVVAILYNVDQVLLVLLRRCSFLRFKMLTGGCELV